MVPPNHAFNRTRRYGAFYLAIVTGGGPVNLVPLGVNISYVTCDLDACRRSRLARRPCSQSASADRSLSCRCADEVIE
jgi:hypothetical protein